MMPYEPVRDVMRRTIQNLEFIEAHKTRHGPYEVTQLVNSFLGALAHPWEKYQRELCGKSLDEAAAVGWPRIIKERPSDRDPRSLGDLIGWIRNAVAHGNLQFLPGTGGEIQALRIWNKEPRHGVRTWGALISSDRYARVPRVFCAARRDPQCGATRVGSAISVNWQAPTEMGQIKEFFGLFIGQM